MSLRSAIETALSALDLIASFTDSPLVATAADFLRALLASPELLAWFEGVFAAASTTDELVLQVTDVPEAIVLEVRERKFDLERIMGLLPTIIALVKLFAK